MRFVGIFLALIAAAFAGAAQADILINIDKSAQRMSVMRDGAPLYDWPVSTGRRGYGTPSGSYTAFRMEADHYSKEWDEAPMPHSIFFTKIGHAIHGTLDAKNIGRPASHGCVRLSTANAETLYALVQQEGVLRTKVVLKGSEEIAYARLKQNKDVAAREQPPARAREPQPYDDRDYARRNDPYDPWAERRLAVPREEYPRRLYREPNNPRDYVDDDPRYQPRPRQPYGYPDYPQYPPGYGYRYQ